MNKADKLISDVVDFRTYCKHLPHISRRESLSETINRNMYMHLDKFPELSRDIIKAYKQVHDLKVMPSMRSLQFGGEAIVKNNTRLFNCSFLHINYTRSFAEIIYLLLCGCGVGYSLQKRHVNQLPGIRKPKRENTHIIHDSIEGWADAVDALMNAYFYGAIRPIFDYSQISPRGTYLATIGAKAPGPDALRNTLNAVEKKLQLSVGKKLSTLQIHDIVCIIADCVLSGGIRRAALIALFDKDDNDMLTCKSGEWWLKAPHRARANNSVLLLRNEVTKKEFEEVFRACIESNSGEPGFIWSDDLELGVNPCCEISLNSNQLCNLTTTNMTDIKSDKDFFNRIYSSALLGTLQATYTDFPYLNENWKITTEREALLGCSFTGIADATNINADILQMAARLVLEVNEKYAKKLDINISARTCAIKPEGSASCVLGSSSGIHSRHSEFYLRRIRLNKDESVAKYLKYTIPDLIEDDLFSARDYVVTIPQESPKGAILREKETALQLLDRVIFYNKNWVSVGHRSGNNKHNVSCTINYQQHEIDELCQQMWKNRFEYSGISLLPFDTGSYSQTPFETCDEKTFKKYNELVKNIDLTKVIEIDDQTNMIEQVACSNGVCEIV